MKRRACSMCGLDAHQTGRCRSCRQTSCPPCFAEHWQSDKAGDLRACIPVVENRAGKTGPTRTVADTFADDAESWGGAA